jgi:hypothetical protein
MGGTGRRRDELTRSDAGAGGRGAIPFTSGAAVTNESPSGLAVVERDVPRLLLGDPAQDLGQQGILLDGDEP